MRQELIEKAKAAKNVEELLIVAKENEIELTLEEASRCYQQLNSKEKELSDEELDNISGGGCNASDTAELAPVKQGLYEGQKVYLREPGHTFGSCYCQNPVCGSSVFWIEKQIDAEKYLLQCNGCDWTYHAAKDNIVAT